MSSHVQAVTISNKQWLLGRLTKAAIRTGATDAHHHLDIGSLITMHYSLWSWDLVKEKKWRWLRNSLPISAREWNRFCNVLFQLTLLSLPDFSKGMKSSKNGLLFISSKTWEKTKGNAEVLTLTELSSEMGIECRTSYFKIIRPFHPS